MTYFNIIRSILFILSLACPASAFAQRIDGVVSDAETNEPIEGITVSLYPSAHYSTTGKDGLYSFENVRPGVYTLQTGSQFYNSFSRVLTIDKEGAVHENIALTIATIRLNKEVVVTAQRFPAEQFNSPEVLSVVSETNLVEYGFGSVPDALSATPGVWMQKTNYGGGSPFIRGLTGQQTLLMIDGIRLNNATYRSGPNQYLNTVDPFALERIEVLRGSASVQYGTDALGGVVQVLTKSPGFSARGLRVSGSIYSKYLSRNMERSVAGEVSLEGKRVAIEVNLTGRDFGDVTAGGNRKLAPTGYDQLAGNFKSLIRMRDDQLLTVTYQQMNQNHVPIYHKVRLEDFLYNKFSLQKRQLAYTRWEKFSESNILKRIQLTGSWQQSNEIRDSQKNGADQSVHEHDKVNTLSFTALVHSEPARNWEINSGIEYYSDRVKSSRLTTTLSSGGAVSQRGLYPDGSTMGNLGIYTHHTYQLSKFILSGSVRVNQFSVRIAENSNEFGSFRLNTSSVVGGFSILYKLHPNHNVVASVNSGFRSPNIDDLGTLGIVDFRYEIPNPDLRAERATTFEVGYKIKSRRLSGSLSAYRMMLSNIIDRVRSGTDSIQGYQVYLKQNVAEASIQGVETELEWKIFRSLVVRNHFMYTYGQNVSRNEPYRRIPPLNSVVGLTYRSKKFWSNLDLQLASKQSRLAAGDVDDNRIPDGGTPGWTVLNLNAGYVFAHRYTVSGGVQNIFDESYRTHGSGVDGYGRSFWVSVRVGFSARHAE